MMDALPTIGFTALGSGLFSAFFITHQYLSAQWTNYLYFNTKVLKRRLPLPNPKTGDTQRYTSENFWDLFVTSVLPVFLLVKHILSRVPTEGLDWSFHPVDIILSTTAIYLCFDTFYYFGHRLLHEVPSLYRAIHKRHHEEVPVHIYLTGKANFLENVFASMPGLTAWVLLTNYGFFRHPGSINLYTIIIPALSLAQELNTAHCGYLDHWLVYATNPISFLIKLIPGARRIAVDHEEHHLLVKKNYAPFFSWFDQWNGTNSFADEAKFHKMDVIENKKKKKEG